MEQTLAKLKRMAAIAMVFVTIAGCQKAPESTNIRTGASPRSQGTTGGTATVGSVQLNGIVTANTTYQDLFNELVRDFMAASIDPQFVGYVSANGSNNTGVYIGGRVEFANGQPLSQGGSGLSPNSQLVVSVFDYWPNQNPPPLPPTYFKTMDVSQSYVSGNSAKLVFADQYGSVILEGTFDNQYFVGNMHFDTQQKWDNSGQGGAGVLGQFKLPTCQFFRCQ